MKIVKIMTISLILAFYATPTYAEEASIVQNIVPNVVHYHPVPHGHRCQTPVMWCHLRYPDPLGAPCICFGPYGYSYYGYVY